LFAQNAKMMKLVYALSHVVSAKLGTSFLTPFMSKQSEHQGIKSTVFDADFEHKWEGLSHAVPTTSS